VAWLAALAGSVLQADAQGTPKGSGELPKASPFSFTPTASAFTGPGQKSGAGTDLSTTFSRPSATSAADTFRLADALGKTDLSSQGAPPPVPGSAAAAVNSGSERPTISGAEASLPASGTASSSGGGGDWLKNAQAYAQLGSMAQNVLSPPSSPGGGIPQAAPMSYSPTANAAMQRLQQLLAMRRGY
jgi:hypothetical protein